MEATTGTTGPARSPASPATGPGPCDAALCTITDARYLLAVYTLVASIRSRGMSEPLCVLGVGLDADQCRLLDQFPNVSVVMGNTTNPRNPTARKGEVLLATAERYPAATYLTLLDGDCVTTGDLRAAYRPAGSGFFGRMRSPAEEEMLFASRYAPEEPRGSIPKAVLEVWRRDVGERDQPRITNTFTGGNLTVTRETLPFVRRWQAQMDRVLPAGDVGSHDPASVAYSQLDESVLNSLLAFAHEVPSLGRHLLDQDPKALLGHLGPGQPRPWVAWRWDRVQYYPYVLAALSWARRAGYRLPPLPWSYQRWTFPAVYGRAAADGLARAAVRGLRRLRAG